MANLTSGDWGMGTVPYTITLKNQSTGEVRKMIVKAHDRLGAVIFCEKTLGEKEWRAQ
jgi:hypothetical protein